MPKHEDNIAESLKAVAPYMGLGIQLAVTIVGMVVLGQWLDERYETGYWLWICATGGVVIGIYSFINTVMNLEKINAKKNGTKK